MFGCWCQKRSKYIRLEGVIFHFDFYVGKSVVFSLSLVFHCRSYAVGVCVFVFLFSFFISVSKLISCESIKVDISISTHGRKSWWLNRLSLTQTKINNFIFFFLFPVAFLSSSNQMFVSIKRTCLAKQPWKESHVYLKERHVTQLWHILQDFHLMIFNKPFTSAQNGHEREEEKKWNVEKPTQNR